MKNTGTLTVTTPTDDEIVLSRVFDAPRARVFEAMTTPALVKRWFGPRGWSCETAEIDLRVGGAWRFVLRGPAGETMGMSGTYRELAGPDRMVHTEKFDAHAAESVVTTTLAESGGKTTFTGRIRYPSKHVRDIVMASGMEHGAAETHDRLAELLSAR